MPKNKQGGWPWCKDCNSYHAPKNPTCKKELRRIAATPIPEEFTIEWQWKRWRATALKEAEIPTGSRQENEMRKAFFSGFMSAGFAFIDGTAKLPDARMVELPQRWIAEYDAFIKRQVALHPLSNQNERGN